MATFYTADLHFGHKKILIYEPKRQELFGDIKNHDEQLIANWNSIVNPEDTVWVLGDPFICGNTYAAEILAKLKGHKFLVLGNHDWERSYQKWRTMGFEFVAHTVKIKVDNQLVWLSHFPYYTPWYQRLYLKYYDKRYDSQKLRDNGEYLIHGHIHSKGEKIRGRQINVGVDVWNFRPVNEVELIKLLRK